MARLNNKKLQTQRNFQSIWHSHPEYIGKILREDQLIREYIIGTMKAKGWKLSEIIIKRKVKQIHIAFQIQNKIIKERKRWTKNRLKNRNRSFISREGNPKGHTCPLKLRLGWPASSTISSKGKLGLSSELRIRRNKILSIKNNKRYLYFQLFLMVTELRKMYPNNQISFYIQKTKPLQFNANLINSWIVTNLKKKSSHKRALNRIIWKYRKGVEKTQTSLTTPSMILQNGAVLLSNTNSNIVSTFTLLKKEDKKKFLSWITGNLIYLYNVHTSKSGIIDITSQLSTTTQQDQIQGQVCPLGIPGGKLVTNNTVLQSSHKTSLYNLSKNKGATIYHKNQTHNKLYWRSDDVNKNLVRASLNYNSFWFRWKKGSITKFTNSSVIGRANLPGKDRVSYNKRLKGRLQVRNYSTEGLHNPITTLTSSLGQATMRVTALNIDQISNIISASITQVEKQKISANQPFIRDITSKLRYRMDLSQADKVLLNTPQEDCEVLLSSHMTSNITQQDSNISQGAIHQDLRSTWKLARKLPRIERRLGNIRRHLWKQHRNSFNEDTLSLLNYYKLRYLLSKKVSQLPGNDDLPLSVNNFLWQGKNFIKFLQLHPPLLDHVIKCLVAIPRFTDKSHISSIIRYNSVDLVNEDQLITFLTQVWIGFFDYIYHYENSLSKWQGIRILLSGRVGFRKMGRAKKYSSFWGVCKNSSARLPLQYSYSQIHTRYGIIGMKIFVR